MRPEQALAGQSVTEPRTKQAVPSDKPDAQAFLAFPTTCPLAATNSALFPHKLKPVRNLNLPNPSAKRLRNCAPPRTKMPDASSDDNTPQKKWPPASVLMYESPNAGDSVRRVFRAQYKSTFSKCRLGRMVDYRKSCRGDRRKSQPRGPMQEKPKTSLK